jgi:acyl-CoA thioesterase
MKAADRGYACATLKISDKKHLNFWGMTHGAVIFAVADHACGACGNSLGRKAVLQNANITYFDNPKPGSVMEAEARMTQESERTGTMIIDVKTSDGHRLARMESVIVFLR